MIHCALEPSHGAPGAIFWTSLDGGPLGIQKTTRKKTTRAKRRRKGEPAWLRALADSEAPEEILLAARRLGVGAQRGRPVVEVNEDSLASLARQGCVGGLELYVNDKSEVNSREGESAAGDPG